MRLLLYNLVFPVLFILYLPIFIYRLVRRGGCSKELLERFGFFSAEKKKLLRQQPNAVWIHAVSVGEMVAALNFIRQWQKRCPEKGFVLSTTTTTGHARAEKALPGNTVLIYSPLDFFFVVKRVLKLVQPKLLVIFEVEIWPNLITLASCQNVPIVLVNGRVSDRSAEGYRKHRWFFAPLFNQFSALCMQTSADAERVQRVVGPHAPIHVCDTMKFDQVPETRSDVRQEYVEKLFGVNPRPLIWTAGSTHAGEEELVAAIYKKQKEHFPNLKLILVPRHHERTLEVENVLKNQELSYVLLTDSVRDKAEQEKAQSDVLLVNTTGELMNFYALADLVFVGKSVAGNEGGHNIIEPAIFGKAIVHGSAMQNFREVARIFADADAAVTVHTEQEFIDAVERLLANAEERAVLGRNAQKVVEEHRGAVDRTIDVLEKIGQVCS